MDKIKNVNNTTVNNTATQINIKQLADSTKEMALALTILTPVLILVLLIMVYKEYKEYKASKVY
jgi:uncharacterized membrane protein YdfJ with MMPL/SSD domain